MVDLGASKEVPMRFDFSASLLLSLSLAVAFCAATLLING